MAKKKSSHAELVSASQIIDAPYELPEGWKWVRLGDVANYINGRAFKPEEWENEGKPIIRIQNLTNSSDTVNRSTKIFEDKYLIRNNDLLYAWSASLGAYLWNGEEGWLNQHIFKVVPNNGIDKKYLYFGLVKVTDNLYAKTHGSGMVHITLKPFLNTLIPIPSTFSEQQRIVNHIESMFAKLDEAKEKAQNVVDSFETRKAAILHQAFTGNLTAKWRKENGVKSDEIKTMLSKLFLIRDKMIEKKEIQRPKIKENFDTNFVNNFFSEWKVVKLGSIAFVTKLAGFEYTKYIKLEETGDIPAIRAQNVRKGYLDESNLLYISKETSEFLQRSALTKKSVLVTFIGAGIGDVCVFDKDRRYHLAPNVAKVEPFNSDKDEYIDVNYILYYLLSHFGQHEIFKDMKATAQPSLSMETIRDITIPIPTIGEQKEIVRILNIVLEKERIAKSAAEQVLEQIDLLKKSILARAFRGEL